MAFTRTFQLGSDGYELDWKGFAVLIKAAGAAREAVQMANEIAVDHAKANHPDYEGEPSLPGERFFNRTHQTVDAIDIIDDAEIEWRPYPDDSGRVFDVPHVWGSWGIHDGPAFQDPDVWSGRWPDMEPKFKRPSVGEEQDLYYPGHEEGIVARALFLEFGTVRMHQRPFIYPAWDYAKTQIWPLLFLFYNSAGVGFHGPRG